MEDEKLRVSTSATRAYTVEAADRFLEEAAADLEGLCAGGGDPCGSLTECGYCLAASIIRSATRGDT